MVASCLACIFGNDERPLAELGEEPERLAVGPNGTVGRRLRRFTFAECDGPSSFDRPASAEHRESGEKRLKLGRKKLKAPIQRRAKGAVPTLRVPICADQKVESPCKQADHLGGGHHLCPRSRQLDRKWNPF